MLSPSYLCSPQIGTLFDPYIYHIYESNKTKTQTKKGCVWYSARMIKKTTTSKSNNNIKPKQNQTKQSNDTPNKKNQNQK